MMSFLNKHLPVRVVFHFFSIILLTFFLVCFISCYFDLFVAYASDEVEKVEKTYKFYKDWRFWTAAVTTVGVVLYFIYFGGNDGSGPGSSNTDLGVTPEVVTQNTIVESVSTIEPSSVVDIAVASSALITTAAVAVSTADPVVELLPVFVQHYTYPHLIFSLCQSFGFITEHIDILHQIISSNHRLYQCYFPCEADRLRWIYILDTINTRPPLNYKQFETFIESIFFEKEQSEGIFAHLKGFMCQVNIVFCSEFLEPLSDLLDNFNKGKPSLLTNRLESKYRSDLKDTISDLVTDFYNYIYKLPIGSLVQAQSFIHFQLDFFLSAVERYTSELSELLRTIFSDSNNSKPLGVLLFKIIRGILISCSNVSGFEHGLRNHELPTTVAVKDKLKTSLIVKKDLDNFLELAPNKKVRSTYHELLDCLYWANGNLVSRFDLILRIIGKQSSSNNSSSLEKTKSEFGDPHSLKEFKK